MTDAPLPTPDLGGAVSPPPAAAVEPLAASPSPAAPAPAIQHPAEVPSLLESLVAPSGDVPAPAPAEPVASAEAALDPSKPPAEAVPAELKPVEAPVEPTPAPAAVSIDPKALKLPEGFTAKPEQLGEFATLFSDANLAAPDKAQKLLDMHTAALKSYAEDLQKSTYDRQVSTFLDTRANWRKSVMADPEFGGAGYKTAMAAVARMRDMFMSREPRGSAAHAAQEKEFVDMLRLTGAGDHPAMVRYLHNVARVFDEAAPPPPNPRPPPDVGKNPNAKGGLRQMYKSSAANGAAR